MEAETRRRLGRFEDAVLCSCGAVLIGVGSN